MSWKSSLFLGAADVLWRARALLAAPGCGLCGSRCRRRSAYNRVFLECSSCGFIFTGDYPEFVAMLGMGMVGSWGGVSKGGEREDFLVRLLHAEFGVRRFLLFGVGATLAFPQLVSEGFDVYGADVSKEVIELRQKEFGHRFFHADHLDAFNGYFDAIIACEVFEHFHRPLFWTNRLIASLGSDGIICGTTNFYPGGPIEDSQKVGYMSIRGHVAYWSESSLNRAFREGGMGVVLFEMVCPGSIKPDQKFGDLFPNKRVFFLTRNQVMLQRFRSLKERQPVLPLDTSDYPIAAYRN